MSNDVAPLQGYPEPYGLLAAILQDGTNEWRNELWHELDAQAVSWRVRPNGQTIGAQMLHIIAVEVGWFERFVLGRDIDQAVKDELMYDAIDVDEGVWPEPPAEPMSWYFALQDRYRARTLELINEFPAADTPIDRRGRVCTPRWVFGHVIQHEAYHGGQIVLMHDLFQRSH
jgi:uncharacterized damage-inducible protein DinB